MSHVPSRRFYLVRHAEKAWSNGRKANLKEGHQHDPPLKDPASCKAFQATLKQLKGVEFDYIHCSPFLRTRETLALITSDERVILSPEIGEYLGNHSKSRLDLSPITASHYSDLTTLATETIKQLQHRVALFLSHLPKTGTFLIVSHGLILYNICGRNFDEGEMYTFTLD